MSPDLTDGGAGQFVTATLAGQICGFPVLKVQDVLGPQQITPVPLAPPDVLGALNLRGRIVTALDLRIRLGLPARDAADSEMGIVVEVDGELYDLIVDTVGDVLSLSDASFEPTPATLDAVWRGVSAGVHRLPEGLMVVLDIESLLHGGEGRAAA